MELPTGTYIALPSLWVISHAWMFFRLEVNLIWHFNSSSKGKKKELVVLLDENSLVKKLVMNESDIETLSGMAEWHHKVAELLHHKLAGI